MEYNLPEMIVIELLGTSIWIANPSHPVEGVPQKGSTALQRIRVLDQSTRLIAVPGLHTPVGTGGRTQVSGRSPKKSSHPADRILYTR